MIKIVKILSVIFLGVILVFGNYTHLGIWNIVVAFSPLILLPVLIRIFNQKLATFLIILWMVFLLTPTFDERCITLTVVNGGTYCQPEFLYLGGYKILFGLSYFSISLGWNSLATSAVSLLISALLFRFIKSEKEGLPM